MAGFQFIHAETFGRASPAKATTTRPTMRHIFAELKREPSAIPHIHNPKLPQLVFGLAPEYVESAVIEAAEQGRDRKGRKLRRDAQLIVAGVASWPQRMEAMSELDWQSYQAWEESTVSWLHSYYGDHLRCVLRHTDEPFPHIHWIAAPDLVAGECIDSIEPGKAAIYKAKAAGVASKSELDRTYRAAMREWQNRYWNDVGSKHALTRFGPALRRLSRAAWHQEKTAAAGLSEAAKAQEAIIRDKKLLDAELVEAHRALERVKIEATSIIAHLLGHRGFSRPSTSRPKWLVGDLWMSLHRRIGGLFDSSTRPSIRPSYDQTMGARD